MLRVESPANFGFRNSLISMAYPALLILPLLLLAGCSGEGVDGPISSSLSASMDATGWLDSDQATHSTVADVGGEDPMITMTSTPAGITADVSWDQPPGFKVTGYTIYYGKRSQDSQSVETTPDGSDFEESHSEELSWCSQGEAKTVDAPSTTITGLEPNTRYFFAIRAFTENESDSLCSNAIVMITPPVEA